MYIFLGEQISSRWLALLENYKEISRKNSSNWVFYDDMQFLDAHIDLDDLLNEKCSKSMVAQDASPEKTELPQSAHNKAIPKSKTPKVYKIKLSNVDLALIQEVRNHTCLYAGKLGSKSKPERDAALKKIAKTILDEEYLARTPNACNYFFF